MSTRPQAGDTLSLNKPKSTTSTEREPGPGLQFDVIATARPEDAAAFMYAKSLPTAEVKHSVTLRSDDFASAREWAFVAGCKTNGIRLVSRCPDSPDAIKRELVQALKDSYQFYAVDMSLPVDVVQTAINAVVDGILVPALERSRGKNGDHNAVHAAVAAAVNQDNGTPTIVDEATRDLHGVVSSLIVNEALKRKGASARVCVLANAAYKWSEEGDLVRIVALAKKTEATSVRAMCSPRLSKIQDLGRTKFTGELRAQHFFALCMVQARLTIESLLKSTCLVFSADEDECTDQRADLERAATLIGGRWRQLTPLLAETHQEEIRRREKVMCLSEVERLIHLMKKHVAIKDGEQQQKLLAAAEERCRELLPERLSSVLSPTAGRPVHWLNNQDVLMSEAQGEVIPLARAPDLHMLEMADVLKEKIKADPLLSLAFNIPDDAKFEFVQMFKPGEGFVSDGQGIMIPPEWKTPMLLPEASGIGVVFCN